MKKVFLIFFAAMFIFMFIFVFEKSTRNPDTQSSKVEFKMDKLHNGDAKLIMDNTVITHIGGKLSFISDKGIVLKKYEDISINWFDVDKKSRIIIYANAKKEVGIIKYDNDYNILSNNVIMTFDDELVIDPSLCRIKDNYFITLTHIIGTVNNSNPDVQNGNYKITLYSSKDLASWKEVSTVISADNNLEDIDLNYYNRNLCLTYERENLDKSNSEINMITSDNFGLNWNKSTTLIENNADNEPASLNFRNNHYYLYYSSDIEKPHSSYEGAKAYVQEFDKGFKKTSKRRKLNLKHNDGDLLYDVSVKDNSIYCLFTEKYITESNLILEKTNINN